MSEAIAKQTLDNYGAKSGGELFYEQEYALKDTMFTANGAALVPTSLFLDGDVKDKMYKSSQFPSNTQAFALTHVSITTDLMFETAAATDQINQLAHFIKCSELVISKDGKEIVRIPVREAVDFSILPAATETASLVKREKFNNKYQLLTPIKIASKERLDFEFVPAKGLTAADAAANITPYHPNAGLTNDRGFATEVIFTARKFQSA